MGFNKLTLFPIIMQQLLPSFADPCKLQMAIGFLRNTSMDIDPLEKRLAHIHVT